MFDPTKLIDADRLSRIAKATVQQTGRLGFSRQAAKMLKLGPGNMSILLFEGEGRNLFLVVVPEHDRRGFYLKQIGEYYYISTRVYFQEKNVDFTSNVVDFEITETTDRFEESPVFSLRYREHARGSKDAEGGSDVDAGADPAQDNPPPAP